MEVKNGLTDRRLHARSTWLLYASGAYRPRRHRNAVTTWLSYYLSRRPIAHCRNELIISYYAVIQASDGAPSHDY